MKKYARKTVQEIIPYAWEDDSVAVAAKFGLRKEDVIRFDMNTSPYPASRALVLQAAEECSNEISEYPDPAYKSLVPELAKYAGCNQNELTICAGCDEIIDVLAKAFVDNGGKVVVSAPTYSMGKICAGIMGGNVVSVLRKRENNYALDPEAVVEAAKGAQMVYLCNPNSPTGNSDELDEVRKVIAGCDCAVVVDEAYFEFWGKTLAPEIGKYENLVVTRTLSKAFGMAGARLGYCIANAELTADINRVRPPNSVSSFSVALASLCLRQQETLKKNTRLILEERDKLIKKLESLGVRTFPTVTNFILADFGSKEKAQSVFDSLLSKGLVVRNFASRPGLECCLRITARDRASNEKLVDEIGRLMKKKICIVCDVDGTLWPGDSIFEAFKFYGQLELGEKAYEWSKNDPAKVAKMFGMRESEVYPGIDTRLIIENIIRENGGLPKADFEKIASGIKLFDGAENFVSNALADSNVSGFFLLSTAYSPFLESLAMRLGLSKKSAIGTRLRGNEGKISEFVGPVMEGEQKEIALRALSKNSGIPLSNFVGIGDSKWDKRFLKAISDAGGLAIAVSLDKELISFAQPRVVMSTPDYSKIYFEIQKFIEGG